MNKSEITYIKEEGFSYVMRATKDDITLSFSEKEDNINIVRTNYRYWNAVSNIKSTNNYDDDYFGQIVRMGEDAVPGILEILLDHPDPIVHALDLIFPNRVEYHNNVSLEDVCEIWIITLLATGKY